MVTSSNQIRRAGFPGQPGARSRIVVDYVGPLAFALMVGYVIIEFTRIQGFLGIRASWFRPALALAIPLCLYWLRQWGAKALVSDRILVYFLLFVVFAAFWTPFALNNYWAMQATKGQMMYLIAGALPLSFILTCRKRRHQFFVLWVGIQLYLSVYALLNGGQGPGGVFRDENDMALALVMGLPFPYFLAQVQGIGRLRRLAYYASVLVILLAIVWTNSRGGFLGLVAVTFYMIYLSKRRLRNLLICAVLGIISLQFVPQTYFDRIQSITDTQDTSRESRLLSWKIASIVFLEHPIVGVGPRNYPWYSGPIHVSLPEYTPGDPILAGRAAHSIYFTILPEYGIVGVILFALLVIEVLRRLGVAERTLLPPARGDPEADFDLALTRALKAAMIGFLVSGAFISVFYYPELWYTLGYVVALCRSAEADYGPAAAPKARR